MVSKMKLKKKLKSDQRAKNQNIDSLTLNIIKL